MFSLSMEVSWIALSKKVQVLDSVGNQGLSGTEIGQGVWPSLFRPLTWTPVMTCLNKYSEHLTTLPDLGLPLLTYYLVPGVTHNMGRADERLRRDG